MLSVFIGGAAVALQRCRTLHLDFHIIVGQQFDGAVFICYINIRKAEILSTRAQNVLIGLDGQHGFGIGCAHRSAVDFLSVRIIANTHEFTRLINAGNLGKVVFHLCLARALAVHKNFHTVGIRVGIYKSPFSLISFISPAVYRIGPAVTCGNRGLSVMNRRLAGKVQRVYRLV